VTYLLAASFFVAVLLLAAVAIHMMVAAHWSEILLALRGEWGGSASPRAEAERPAPAAATTRRRAAA
jgi:hypothetical protein